MAEGSLFTTCYKKKKAMM